MDMYKTIMKIEGMMCGMCEAHINEAIRKAVPEASKVKSSHVRGESSFISETEPDKEKLSACIDKTGYSVISVRSEIYNKKLFGLF